MATRVTNSDGSLYFAAGINLSDFDKDTQKMSNAFDQIKKQVADLSKSMQIGAKIDTKQALKQIGEIEVALSKATAKGFDTGRLYQQLDELRKRVNAQPLTIAVTADTKQAVASIETLRAKMLLKQQAIVETTDIKKIAQYNKEIEGLQTQITTMSNAGKTGFDEMGNAVERTAKKGNILQRSFGFLKQAALFLPGIGIVGIMGLISDSVFELVANLLKGENAFAAFSKRIKAVGDAFDSSTYQNAVKNVNELRINIDLAKQGIIKKEAVLKQYNDSIGQTTGAVSSLEAAEKALAQNADAYIRMTLNKAAAQSLLDEAADKAVEIAKKRNLADAQTVKNITTLSQAEAKRADFLKNDPTYKNIVSDLQAAVLSGDVDWQKTMQTRVDDYKKAILERFRFGKELKEQSGLEDLAKEFQTKAAQIAAEFKFNFAGEEAWGKEKEHHEKVNALIGRRLTILEQIEGLRRDGIQAGLIKEESALDKINEKYAKAIAEARAFNKEVDKAKPKDRVEKINVAEIEALQKVEYQNTVFKQEAEAYKQGLEERREAFEAFSNTQKEIGIESARELYREQTKGFDSYLDYLKSQLNDKGLVLKITTGTANIGEILKFRAIAKEMGEEQTKQQEEQIQNFIKMLQATATFADQEAAVNRKYNDLEIELDKAKNNGLIKNYEDRLKVLKEGRSKELTDLKNHIIRQGELYKKLGQDVISFMGDDLMEQIKSFQKELATNMELTPQMKADIQGRIDQLIQLWTNADKATQKSMNTASQLAAIGSGLSQVAGAIGQVNEELGATIGNIATMTNVMAGAIKSMNDFNAAKLSKDVTGQITAITGLVSAIVTVGANLVRQYQQWRQMSKDANQQVQDFYTRISTGELEINQLYRERLRQQHDINDTKLEGLRKEAALLNKQAEQSKNDYKKIFADIAKEQYIAGEKTKRQWGSVGPLGDTKVVQEMASLAGKSFEQLEELFIKGQLTEKAAALFEQLQKLKAEGVDIEQQLRDIATETAQIFTGTTADSLTDAITDMFRAGKTSAQDFADFFKQSMGEAALSIFKNQAIAERMKEFYKEFAEAAQSDNELTSAEISRLDASFQGKMQDLSKLFENMQKVSGLNLQQQTSSVNSLQGAIRAQLTEETGTILAGHSNGIRLSLVDLVRLASVKIQHLNAISINTANMVKRQEAMERRFDHYETGARKLHVRI